MSHLQQDCQMRSLYKIKSIEIRLELEPIFGIFLISLNAVRLYILRNAERTIKYIKTSKSTSLVWFHNKKSLQNKRNNYICS